MQNKYNDLKLMHDTLDCSIRAVEKMPRYIDGCDLEARKYVINLLQDEQDKIGTQMTKCFKESENG